MTCQRGARYTSKVAKTHGQISLPDLIARMCHVIARMFHRCHSNRSMGMSLPDLVL